MLPNVSNSPPSFVVARRLDPRVLATLGFPPTTRWLPKLRPASIRKRGHGILVVPFSHRLQKGRWTSLHCPRFVRTPSVDRLKQPSLLVNYCCLDDRGTGRKGFLWLSIDSHDQGIICLLRVFRTAIVSGIVMTSHGRGFLVDIMYNRVEQDTIHQGIG